MTIGCDQAHNHKGAICEQFFDLITFFFHFVAVFWYDNNKGEGQSDIFFRYTQHKKTSQSAKKIK